MSGNHIRLLGDKLTVPTGPKTVRVGGRSLRVPADAALAAGPSGLTYLLAAGRVHCFSPRGEEISVPISVQNPLRRAYFVATT